jgi:hypothetical protein
MRLTDVRKPNCCLCINCLKSSLDDSRNGRYVDVESRQPLEPFESRPQERSDF